MEVLATRADYNRARTAVLNYLTAHGPSDRTTLTNLFRQGITSEAISLAIAGLLREGVIIQLYTPRGGRQGAGSRPTWYALRGQEPPGGTLLVEDALSRIGD